MNITQRVARAIAGARTPAHFELRGDDLAHAIAYHGVDATAAINAFLAGIAEKGWRIVPDKATAEMELLVTVGHNGNPSMLDTYDAASIYRAMLDKAPKFEVGDG